MMGLFARRSIPTPALMRGTPASANVKMGAWPHPPRKARGGPSFSMWSLNAPPCLHLLHVERISRAREKPAHHLPYAPKPCCQCEPLLAPFSPTDKVIQLNSTSESLSGSVPCCGSLLGGIE